jgi:hypothetical protein
MTVAAPPPPPTIVAAVKSVYPRSAIDVTKVCRVDLLAFVRLRVRGRDAFVALRKLRRGWQVVWVDGAVTRSVPVPRRAAIAAQVAMLRTRCLAP